MTCFELPELQFALLAIADSAERAVWLHANVDSDLQYIWQESGIGADLV